MMVSTNNRKNKDNPYKSPRSRLIKPFLTLPFFIVIIYSYHLSVHSSSQWNALDLGIRPTVDTFLSKDFGFHESWHPALRQDRFPSRDERLKIYLSNWYQPPCITEDIDERIGYSYDLDVFPQVALNDRMDQVMLTILDTTYNTQVPVVLYEKYLKECKSPDCQAGQRMLFDICIKYFGEMFQASSEDKKITSRKEWLPVIMYFGKGILEEMDITYPFFASYRFAVRGEHSIQKATKEVNCQARAQRQIDNLLHTVSKEKVMSPIIWDIHDLKSKALSVLDVDISWQSKINQAVWRGKLSGNIQEGEGTFEQKCSSNLRCRFVQKAASIHKLLNVGVTQQRQELILDKSLHHLVKSPMTIQEHLKYKIMIVVEGDGYATTLAWALYSNSVVIMPKPTKTSFLMEEKLEPWIHYIPCRDDFDDLEKKIRWVVRNGSKAKTIAERATLWIHDLYMSHEAKEDNDFISKEIVQRYLKFYVNENTY